MMVVVMIRVLLMMNIVVKTFQQRPK